MRRKDFLRRHDWIGEPCDFNRDGVSIVEITEHTLQRWRRKARKANRSLWDKGKGGQALIDDVIRVLAPVKGKRK